MYVCMCGNGSPRTRTHRSTCCGLKVLTRYTYFTRTYIYSTTTVQHHSHHQFSTTILNLVLHHHHTHHQHPDGWTAVRAPRGDLCASGGPIPHQKKKNQRGPGAAPPQHAQFFDSQAAPWRFCFPPNQRQSSTCRFMRKSKKQTSTGPVPRRRSTRNFLIPSPAAFFFSSPSATYATGPLC